jgi:hypothetical protein
MGLVFVLTLSLYALLSMGPATPFNAHVHLAHAWLSGLVTPLTLPAYLEHAPGPTGAIIPYGPGPALLLLPFVAIWGLATDQSAFCMALGALNVALMWSLAGRLGAQGGLRTALTVLFGLGSPHLFYAVQSGNTWPMMHIVTIFGLLVALRAVFSPPTLASGLGVGLGLGLAFLTRQPAALAVPFIALLSVLEGAKPSAHARHSRESGNPLDSRFCGSNVGVSGSDARVGSRLVAIVRSMPWQRLGGFALGFGLCGAFTLAYNWARMGNPLDTGYERVIMAITPPHMIPHGVFSPEYLLRNLHAYFLSGPERIADFPYFRPSQFQMSMVLVFPALFLVPLADWRQRKNWLMMGAIASMMAVYLVYYWTGATQFGMRYAMDWLPLAMVLIASAGNGKSPLVWLAAVLGIAVEAWGLVMWRLLGWA